MLLSYLIFQFEVIVLVFFFLFLALYSSRILIGLNNPLLSADFDILLYTLFCRLPAEYQTLPALALVLGAHSCESCILVVISPLFLSPIHD